MVNEVKSVSGHTFHRTFYIGACLKGLQGILETLGGVVLWFLNPKILHDVAALFVKHELSEYPQNFMVRYIHHAAAHWSLSTQHFGAIYLLIDGLITVGLVIGMLRKIWWSYPLAAALISLFILYQLHRAERTHSATLFFLSLMDAVIVLLIIREYYTRETR
jgi:uncharacterized membrane protein